jgi:hypothetical protein
MGAWQGWHVLVLHVLRSSRLLHGRGSNCALSVKHLGAGLTFLATAGWAVAYKGKPNSAVWFQLWWLGIACSRAIATADVSGLVRIHLMKLAMYSDLVRGDFNHCSERRPEHFFSSKHCSTAF